MNYRKQNMKTYACVWVSAKDQNVRRQLDSLIPFEIPQRNIFCDCQSGKDFNRPQYRKLMKKMRERDLLIIKSIDRLGRNYDEILEQWRKIKKKITQLWLVLDRQPAQKASKNFGIKGRQ